MECVCFEGCRDLSSDEATSRHLNELMIEADEVTVVAFLLFLLTHTCYILVLLLCFRYVQISNASKLHSRKQAIAKILFKNLLHCI